MKILPFEFGDSLPPNEEVRKLKKEGWRSCSMITDNGNKRLVMQKGDETCSVNFKTFAK